MADNLDGLASAAGAGSPSLTSAFEELLRSNIANRPTPQERQGALTAYTDAIKAPADTRDDWEVMLGGRLAAENPFDPRQAGVAAMKYKMMWDQTQREAVKKQNEMAAKAQYDDIVKRQSDAIGGAGMATQFAHAALNPIMNIGGVGVNRQTGRVIVPKDYIPIHSKVREDAYKAAIEQKMPNPEQYADQQADAYIMKVLQNASTSGPGFAQRPGQAPLPAQGLASAQVPAPAPPPAPSNVIADNAMQTPEGPEVIDKTQGGMSFDVSGLGPEERAQVMRLIARYRANPNPGTQEATARAINDLISKGSIKKAAPSSSIAYQNQAAQAARKETEIESAKMYATSFNENVVKPAVAFSNTGKIMQDFNTLGQMNHALKNGKLKEFLAGDAGKYALSFLPENSDLRKGIANAQEAEKLTAGMVNQILLAAKGVQTEGDAQRARSQVTSIGTDLDANAYLEAYISETARQLKMREQFGLSHKKTTGSFENYDEAWMNSPLMKEAKGSVKKLGNRWIGATQYIEKFKSKNPEATDSDAIQSWNRIQS